MGDKTYDGKTNYTVIPYDEKKIVYSKLGSDLPITSTKIEYKPCMTADDESRAPGQTFASTELTFEDCQKDHFSNETYDSRYENTGFSIDMYDFQKDNKVIDALKASGPNFKKD